MKRRVLLAVLLCISFSLGIMIHVRDDVDKKMHEASASLESLPKEERNLFNSNAIDYYKHWSKSAREERKRLRTLHNQLQNDPECELLTKTMEQYVDWIKRIGNPAMMRMIQSRSIDDRVEEIRQAVQDERQDNSMEIFPIEQLREYIREGLPPELREFDFPAIYPEFDGWLTKKYDAEKARLSEEQTKLSADRLAHLPMFEKLYVDMFRPCRADATSGEQMSVPEKLAMLQLLRNLNNFNNPPRFWGGGGGGGGRGGDRWLTAFSWLTILTLREEFFDEQKAAFAKGEPNLFNQLSDLEVRQKLLQMSPSSRNDALQRFLTLAYLDHYPKFSFAIFGFGGPNRGGTSGQGFDEMLSIDILGTYLSLVSATRCDEFLQMDPHYANIRLRGELRSNALVLIGLTRPSYDRMGGGPPGSSPGAGPGGPGSPDAPRGGPGGGGGPGRQEGGRLGGGGGWQGGMRPDGPPPNSGPDGMREPPPRETRPPESRGRNSRN